MGHAKNILLQESDLNHQYKTPGWVGKPGVRSQAGAGNMKHEVGIFGNWDSVWERRRSRAASLGTAVLM